MELIDWSIVAGLLVLMVWAVHRTKKHTRGVADFLVANRCAGRYLITVGSGAAGTGAITIIATFELFYAAGFSAVWWNLTIVATMLVIYISGWIIYRLRQTRVLTTAQFLEVRYSRKFRIFAGMVAYMAGIINFGIFPAVGARFFIYFCSFPEHISIFGVSISTFALIIFVLLLISLFFISIGGQIAIIVTDFIQGVFCNLWVIVIAITALFFFDWSQISEALLTAPESASLMHPFHTQEAEDFNVAYFLITSFAMFYGIRAWQGGAGYRYCALNAHEARMGEVLNALRVFPIDHLFLVLLPICAYTLMHHPDFASKAESVRVILSGISNPAIQEQLTTSLAMKAFLPVGIAGGMAALILAAFISTHDTYLHSWGSIFIQDVIMPFRKKPFTPQQHLLLLRLSILGVAVFVFFFSLLFRQTEYILMFFQITGAIFIGGAGAVIIGGLYWKRGTTAAAWSAMITGSTLAVSAIVLKQINEYYPFNLKVLTYITSKSGAVLGFYTSLTAILVYVLVSLLGKRGVFNMDKMLHRGKYAIDEPVNPNEDKPVRGIRALIGMGREFNRKDKIIYLTTIAWNIIVVVIFVIGVCYNYMVDVKTDSWVEFWRYYLWFFLISSPLIVIWLTFGGFRDLKRMFALLSKIKRDELDDGMVVDHHNTGEKLESEASVN